MWWNKWRKPRKQLSILVPYQTDEPYRIRSWAWLRQYWESQLPDAEIIIGRDRRSKRRWYRRKPKPFSKSVAVNYAARRARGDVFLVVDSDVWLDARGINAAAERIRLATAKGVHTWFMPYRHLYRLTEQASDEIVATNPDCPYWYPQPPPLDDVEGIEGSLYGHLFGAMGQLMPRQAFYHVGGWDRRFRGWGGEDGSVMRAVDTLWGPHFNLPNDVLHIWHPKLHAGSYTDITHDHQVRVWPNQTTPSINGELSKKYISAMWDPDAMRKLVKEGHRCRLRS